ncbi:hypothetical protein AS200_42750 [Streptomyces sp. CdTB01]|nr:hypothetical protein AS200_42750 [Streptomyces sp. CdTB01]
MLGVAVHTRRHWADLLTDVIDKATTGMGEGAPTTARLREVLDRAACVVIAEGPPDEAASADVARIEVSEAAIAELAESGHMAPSP